MKASVGASGSLILYADHHVADHFAGRALDASVGVKDGTLAIVVRGHDGRGPHFRRLNDQEHATDFQFNNIRGWGRRCPRFRKMTGVASIGEGGELVVNLPLDGMRAPIQRGRRAAAAASGRAASPPVADTPSVSCGDLRGAVQTVNALKAQMGEGLQLSIASDGTLRALVEYS